MFMAKFWHSAELARKQAYINVAKASILQAHVLASPDAAHFISLLCTALFPKGVIHPRRRVDAWVGALRALPAWLINCNDHI